MRHHHGYTWLGTGYGTVKDGPLRADHPEFAATGMPPLELAHWLLKPATFVRGTWTDPLAAASWFGAQAREHLGTFVSGHDGEALEEKIAAAAKSVAAGEDIAGGWWLTGQRFLAVHLIACSPNRQRPNYPCPGEG